MVSGDADGHCDAHRMHPKSVAATARRSPGYRDFGHLEQRCRVNPSDTTWEPLAYAGLPPQSGPVRFQGVSFHVPLTTGRFPTAVLPQTAQRVAVRVDSTTGTVRRRNVRRRRSLCDQVDSPVVTPLLTTAQRPHLRLPRRYWPTAHRLTPHAFCNFRNYTMQGRATKVG